MICPKCGVLVPEGRATCASCGAPTLPKTYTDFERAEREMKVGNPKETGFFYSKEGILLMGAAETFIGIFSILYLLFSLPITYGEFVIIVGGLGIFTVVLPITGVLLILFDNYKAGGIILIIGSIFCLPIGIIGVYAGSRAMKLGGSG